MRPVLWDYDTALEEARRLLLANIAFTMRPTERGVIITEADA